MTRPHLLARALAAAFLSLAITGCHNIAPPSCSGAAVETHYSPTENLETLDASVFATAHNSIDLCAYSFTDRALGRALISAAHRGVRIRIYLDQGQGKSELTREKEHSRRPSEAEDDTSDAGRQVLLDLAATPNVSIKIKHSRTLMHLKTYVVDGTTLRSGSANFSPSGEKHQDNDLTLTKDRASVGSFSRNFEVLWHRRDNSDLSVLAQQASR